MPQDKLVLYKSLRLRWIEAIVIAAAGLAVGPAMRAFLGDQYSPNYGFPALILLAVLVSRLSGIWAIRLGAEWMTESERLTRMASEANAAPSWLNALATSAMFALSMIAVFLIIDPLDEFGAALGGAPLTLGLIAALSLSLGGRAFYGQRRLTEFGLARESPPSLMGPELRRTLPWTYLAYAVGTAAGLAIAFQIDGDARYAVFVAISLVAAHVLQLFANMLGRQRPCPNFSRPNFLQQALLGLALWGVPMAILFSGMVFLTTNGVGGLWRTAMFLGVVILLCLVGGLCFGAGMYFIRRFSDPEKVESK